MNLGDGFAIALARLRDDLVGAVLCRVVQRILGFDADNVIADAGDRMPRKSTYFYPKSPAGLVVYKW